MIEWAALLALTAVPAAAHVMSTSQGELTLSGNEVHYELKMPLYEIAEVASPEPTLLDAFIVTSDGAEPLTREGNCREEAAEDLYVCDATYTFPDSPRAVQVRCEYAAVTVPNHVHILRSGEGELSRQTMFDIASPEADIRFVEPTAGEIFWTQFSAGLRRVAISPVLVLFLTALNVAARTKSDALQIVAAFLGVEVVASLVFQTGIWSAPTRFVEAAGALTIAYVAVEVLLLPDAGKRWLIAGGLGLFHGLFFGGFMRQADLAAGYFLPGVLLCELAVLAVIGVIWQRVRGRRQEQLAALLLLVAGMGWFVIRLQS